MLVIAENINVMVTRIGNAMKDRDRLPSRIWRAGWSSRAPMSSTST